MLNLQSNKSQKDFFLNPRANFCGSDIHCEIPLLNDFVFNKLFGTFCNFKKEFYRNHTTNESKREICLKKLSNNVRRVKVTISDWNRKK